MTSRSHISVQYKNYGGFIRMGGTKDIFAKIEW